MYNFNIFLKNIYFKKQLLTQSQNIHSTKPKFYLL